VKSEVFVMNRLASLFLVLALTVPLRAAEPKGFPDAKHGKGELRHVDGVPVLLLKGTPAEMGEQFGVLAIKNAPDIDGFHKAFLKDAGLEKRYTLLRTMASLLKPNFPKHVATEVEAAAKAADRDLSFLLFANTVADLSSGMGCSTVVVEKDRSATASRCSAATSTGSRRRGSTSTRWSSSTRARESGRSRPSRSRRSRG
jgi:isopenicillin-N N-acyltransferase-like protein